MDMKEDILDLIRIIIFIMFVPVVMITITIVAIFCSIGILFMYVEDKMR